MPYAYHIIIALDQLFNALLAGEADETLSSRTHRRAVLAAQPKRRWRTARRLINGLFFWQQDHCRASYESELARKHMDAHFKAEQCLRNGGQ